MAPTQPCSCEHASVGSEQGSERVPTVVILIDGHGGSEDSWARTPHTKVASPRRRKEDEDRMEDEGRKG
tara:strand:- start:2783 stop:2989 length:207 start_codon:yes stop_codon:yes gene_type:complete